MIISDGKARRIASEWHGGQTTGLCSFATTGMIDDRVQQEVEGEVSELQGDPDCTPAEQEAYLLELCALRDYLDHHGHRTPVDGWARNWE